MLGANIISIMDTVITCAPRESAVSSYIWKNGMGKTVYNFLLFYKGRFIIYICTCNLTRLHNYLLLGSCYRINKDKINSIKKPLFSFKNEVRYYQKKTDKPPLNMKNNRAGFRYGSGIIGSGLTLGRDGSFVFGSSNFNLGDPTKTCNIDGTNKAGDCRYGGFGNILKFGILDESGENSEILLNPSKDKDKNEFRLEFKKEFNEKNSGTPSIYLGSTVIRGNVCVVLKNRKLYDV